MLGVAPSGEEGVGIFPFVLEPVYHQAPNANGEGVQIPIRSPGCFQSMIN